MRAAAERGIKRRGCGLPRSLGHTGRGVPSISTREGGGERAYTAFQEGREGRGYITFYQDKKAVGSVGHCDTHSGAYPVYHPGREERAYTVFQSGEEGRTQREREGGRGIHSIIAFQLFPPPLPPFVIPEL